MNGAAGVDVASGARAISAAEFEWLRRFLFERTGIELRPGKESMVAGRLDRRLRHHGLAGYSDYFALLAGPRADPAETTAAIDLLTTNETYFFREPQHFELLREHVTRRRSTQVLRVWSAASSTGEEAYTVALTLADALPHQAWEVLGTDISTRVLETARRGLYPMQAAARIPRSMLRQHCLRGRDEYEGQFTLDRALMERVSFRHANLDADLPDIGTFDVVFLRNVMIYFGLPTKQAVVTRVRRLIRPGGLLVLSHSETLHGITTDLRPVVPSVFAAPDTAAGEPR